MDTRLRFVLLLPLFVAGCSIVNPSLEDSTLSANRFALVYDDGLNSVWTARSMSKQAGAEWGASMKRERKRVEDFFASPIAGSIELRLVDSFPKDFDGDGFGSERRIFLRVPADGFPRPDDSDLLAHELTHVSMGKISKADRPFWFEEGVPTYVEGGRLGFGADGKDLLTDMPGLDKLPIESLKLSELDRYEHRKAYRLGGEAVLLIVQKHGLGALRRLAREARTAGFDETYFQITGEQTATLAERWRAAIRRAATPASAAK